MRRVRPLCRECAHQRVYRPKGHKGQHGDPVLMRWWRKHNPSRRAQRRRRPEVVDMGRWMSGSNPRQAKRRTPFLRNPSERAIMRKAMKAAWRKIRSR